LRKIVPIILCIFMQNAYGSACPKDKDLILFVGTFDATKCKNADIKSMTCFPTIIFNRPIMDNRSKDPIKSATLTYDRARQYKYISPLLSQKNKMVVKGCGYFDSINDEVRLEIWRLTFKQR
jgi:hypothetical protein